MLQENEIGEFKYEGRLVDEGIIDARAASRALGGIDRAIRYFATQEQPELAAPEYPIPVRIKSGSWTAIIPESVGGWILAGASLITTAYLSSAASTVAENDFKDVTLKKVIVKSLSLIQELIKIGKHLGHIRLKSLRNLRLDKEDQVGIENRSGLVIYISLATWRRIENCPPSLLSGIADVVEEERSLTVGVRYENTSSEVTISKKDKHIFAVAEDERIVLPELKHGERVSLIGVVTRENGRTKTLGFYYNDHIITCKPADGNILPYKKNLFLKCRIDGVVTRESKDGQIRENRPKITFTDLEALSNTEQTEFDLIDEDDES